MTSAQSDILVDTNVLVYAYDPSDPIKRQRATVVIATLEASSRGYLSTQVLGEFFNTATRKIAQPLTVAEAERSVARYVRSWPVLGITATTVIEAVRGVRQYQLPYCDAVIWATAKLGGLRTILSEDFNDGAVLGGVRFVNPFTTTFDMSQL